MPVTITKTAKTDSAGELAALHARASKLFSAEAGSDGFLQLTSLLQQEKGWSEHDLVQALEWLARPTAHPIVSVKEFIESPYYMATVAFDGTHTIYPEVMRHMERINSGEYDEVVATGSIGAAKTTLALYSTAYQLYVLSCYENPHSLFGLDPSSEIVFIFQSIHATAAKTVDYQRFRAMIEKSPYFKEQFPFDATLESELIFPKRICVRPVSGKDTAAIGQNVFGGVIDEVNFMALIEKSSQSIDKGVYDQAKALYDSISKRRKSRFGQAGGRLPGLLFMVSSARYPGQFTDRKIAEAQEELSTKGVTRTYVYNKRVWDIRPEKFANEPWFKLFVGDEGRKPRILEPGEESTFDEKDQHLIDTIPEEFRRDFENDPMGSLRDIAGVSTIARHPYIQSRESVVACTRKDRIIFSREAVNFADTKLLVYPKQFHEPKLQRFVHCDLALTGDSAGMAIGTVLGFKTIARGPGQFEILPDIYIDGLLEIYPPKGGEILFYKVREVIYALKKHGLNIQWCSFDQFQSRDSMQLLTQAGYQVGYQSIDINTMPYDFLKNALYDKRVSMPYHTKCISELASLEKNVKKNKIDHPPGMSKDVSDALAGVVFGLTMRREIWGKHGISLGAIPDSIKQAIAHKNAKNPEATIRAERKAA